MKKPKNVYIRDLMDSRQHNVLKLPCGWLIIHLQTRKFGSYVDLRSQNGQPMLHERCEFYEAELINDDARRWNGYVMGATIDNSFIPYLVDPENIFLSKDWMIAGAQLVPEGMPALISALAASFDAPIALPIGGNYILRRKPKAPEEILKSSHRSHGLQSSNAFPASPNILWANAMRKSSVKLSKMDFFHSLSPVAYNSSMEMLAVSNLNL